MVDIGLLADLTLDVSTPRDGASLQAKANMEGELLSRFQGRFQSFLPVTLPLEEI